MSIHLEKPAGFRAEFEVSSVFLEHRGKFLVLQRQEGKPQPHTYGVPAGKKRRGESNLTAAIRETLEETGAPISRKATRLHTTVFVRYPHYDFVYHIFHSKLGGQRKPIVKLDTSSHKQHKWVTPEQSLKLPLIQDLDACIKLFYNQ